MRGQVGIVGGHREEDVCDLLCLWKVLGCGTRSSPRLYVISDKTKAISQLGPFPFPFTPPLASLEEEGFVCCWRG